LAVQNVADIIVLQSVTIVDDSCPRGAPGAAPRIRPLWHCGHIFVAMWPWPLWPPWSSP